MSFPPRNIDLLARCIDNNSFRDDMLFAGRFKARREAMRLVESDHVIAAFTLTLAMGSPFLPDPEAME